MSLVRMFHYSCDSYQVITAGYRECDDSMGDDWYATDAKRNALADGWHISADGKLALCAPCWERGIRFKDLTRL